jgi:hypothetical protein
VFKVKQPIIALPKEPVEHPPVAVATLALAVALLNEVQRLNKIKLEAATITVALCLVLRLAAVLCAITAAISPMYKTVLQSSIPLVYSSVV